MILKKLLICSIELIKKSLYYNLILIISVCSFSLSSGIITLDNATRQSNVLLLPNTESTDFFASI